MRQEFLLDRVSRTCGPSRRLHRVVDVRREASNGGFYSEVKVVIMIDDCIQAEIGSYGDY